VKALFSSCAPRLKTVRVSVGGLENGLVGSLSLRCHGQVVAGRDPGVARWAVTAAGLLVISGLTRLIEFWIQNVTAGVQ
jgi:hypothetical protein